MSRPNPDRDERVRRTEQPQHVATCAWERTTSAECEYRDTHHYCPHVEHACTCPPRTKSLVQHLDERMISANNVLGFLLAAIEADEEDMTNRGRESAVVMLIEIAKRRKEAGTLYVKDSNDAATRMRDRCVEKVRAIRNAYGDGKNREYDYGFHRALDTVESALSHLENSDGRPTQS